eukprot:CAMPEP_0206536264 /NCGR_PEP_ID=MMETSP0325_2-20121206/6649_1 /ASSEMBLY_ACC=CAM_ASM_000347 /TAXON_ID=2866 /ORGANISM="Crypthecodinium cohnii, Strain Seligo" /LENGTH=334 /DNA_ID=CAMNT_0054033449 /DNA_START=53 /DNA_END=1053 /DNA_ORIENTATION=+
MADGQFDDALLAMAQQHKSIEDLSYSVLSFFERRTDLFHVMETPQDRMGFKPGAAEKMVLKHFKYFQHKHMAREQPEMLKKLYNIDGPPPQAAVANSPEEAAARAAKEAKAQAAATSSTSSGTGGSTAVPEKTKKMMQHISTWNGAVTDKYHWSQSIRDVTLEIEVEECRAKELQVNITATRLSVKCKGQTILEGKLYEKVNTEETIWHLEDRKQVIITLEKQRGTWWKCVLEGDQEIDTTKVESTRRMDEYDGETQGAIRKIMFDQNQKLKGAPTSDQIRTADVMKEAWNAPGSPFRGSEFDPSMLNLSGPVSEDFFQDVEKRRIEAARGAQG